MNRLSQVSEQLTTPNLMPELRKEATMEAQDFKETVWGPNWHWRERGFKYILQNMDKHPYYHINEASREEQRRETANLMKFYADNRDVTNEEYDRDHNTLTLWSNGLYSYSPGFCIKNAVHIMLYLKTLIMLGTEKHQCLIGRAYDHKDIGCFALTEALHGTNVKGLLTEAHYDHASKEFILHSPNRDAMKFWIGAASNLATITAAWAQLYIDGVCYGVHVFVVPLRDPLTHELLPGVLIGDCGPKNGLNEVDNGFILFNKVRIPANNLLNRLSGVDADGKFYNTCKNEDTRFGLQLGAISGGRIAIAMSAPTTALNALSIAVRYCCIRKQFSAPGSADEMFLFQYPLTRHRLMPLLAQAVVYQQVGSKMNLKWDRSYKKLLEPNNPDIEEQHSISSVMKAQSSWFTSETINECRQMLGGHGYSAFSRLGSMYQENDINKTWEGDNTVLLQQSLKFVLEAAQNMTKGKPIEVEMLKFLSEPPFVDEEIKAEQLQDLDFIQQIFEVRVSDKLQETGMRLLDLKTKNYPLFDIWNHSQVGYGQNLALYYGDLVYLIHAKKALTAFRSPANRVVYKNCIVLWALRTLKKDAYGTPQTQALVRSLMEDYCEIIAKEALVLLEVLAAPSKILNSPFANEEGKGMALYLNMIYTGKDTFRKVDWYKLLTDRDRS